MSSTNENSAAVKRKSEPEPEAGDATKKSKLSFSFGVKKPPQNADEEDSSNTTSAKLAKKVAPVTLKLGAPKPKEPEKKVVVPSKAVAKAFADESDEDDDEMPAEAKMRMKNIGRNTPTSAGPNSFNKGRMGFCSPGAKWKLQRLKCDAEKLAGDKEDS